MTTEQQLNSLCTPSEVTELCAVIQAEIQSSSEAEWFGYLGNSERDAVVTERAVERKLTEIMMLTDHLEVAR